VLAETARRLALAGCETPRVDAEILLAHVLGTTRSGLVAGAGRELGADEAATLDELVRRRETREPLAYVLGEWGFRRLTLTTDRRALVPRPETEVVVERCLSLLRGRTTPRVLDVGTGSGAIALAIADEHPGARVTGVDLSTEALELAQENAARTGLAIELAARDLHTGLPPGPWDLVVSNPPYVAPAELEWLAEEVREWEPRVALVADGAVDHVALSAPEVLVAGGALVLEVASGDAARVSGLLGELGYRDVRVTRDLAGRERVVEGVRP
jgi:release factor glutamine methyltransferase